jgi:hypothetical protein
MAQVQRCALALIESGMPQSFGLMNLRRDSRVIRINTLLDIPLRSWKSP